MTSYKIEFGWISNHGIMLKVYTEDSFCCDLFVCRPNWLERLFGVTLKSKIDNKVKKAIDKLIKEKYIREDSEEEIKRLNFLYKGD